MGYIAVITFLVRLHAAYQSKSENMQNPVINIKSDNELSMHGIVL